MKIFYENIPDNDEGENFKTEARLIVTTVFANPHTPATFNANIERLTDNISKQLEKSGYVYNRANLTFDTVHKDVQGFILAVHGPAGDGPTLAKWAKGGMKARFTIPVDNGKIWAGAAS